MGGRRALTALIVVAALLMAGASGSGQPTTTPSQGRLYIANLRSSDITVVDVASSRVIATILLPPNPHELALSSDGRELVTGLYRSDLLALVDTATLELRLEPAPVTPHGVVFLDDAHLLLAADAAGGVTWLDGRDGRALDFTATGRTTHALAVDAARGRAYVANADDDTLSALDTSERLLIGSVQVGRTPESVAITPDGRLILTANAGDNTVSIIEARTLREVARLPLDGKPVRVAVSPDGRVALVSLSTTASVAVLDLEALSVIREVVVGPGPDGIAFDTDGSFAFVASTGGNRVVALDTTSWRIVSWLPAGDGPSGLAFDGGNPQTP